jgi:hypothetical protein
MSAIRRPKMRADKLSLRVCSGLFEDRLRLHRKQSLARSPALDVRLYLADHAAMRDLILRFHTMANDTSPKPSINKAPPNMRRLGGAVIQGIIVRNSFGLEDSLPASWSGVRLAVMDTAIPPRMSMSHPVSRTPLQRNCNLRRRSNRRAASTFGDVIRVPCEYLVALEIRFVPELRR